LLACGARSELLGYDDDSDGDGDGSVDATLDVVHVDGGPTTDASTDAVADTSVDAFDAGLCCDLGIKQSGCQQCGAGESCWNKVGACTHDVTTCGPSNCKGCCLTATWCADGTEVGACGTGGQMCQTCFDSKNKLVACVPNDAGAGGTCQGGPTCTTQSCGSGCCNGNVCMLGELDTSCGYATMACADCTKLSGYCDGGRCVVPHQ
jgi:hypothetical protein